MKDKKSDIYIKIYNSFIDLDSGILDKVIVTPNEMAELGFITPHNEVICDNNGNFVCKYIDTRYCNYADILKKHFGDRLVQEIDIATGNYIFKKSKKGDYIDMLKIKEYDKLQLKELLERLKDINNYTGFKDGAFKYYLGKYEANILLDYITNLQNRILYLERSNNRREDDILYKRQEISDLEDKIDKAIEFIKENSLYYADDNYGDLCGDTNTLLNILQGSDK